MPEELSFRDYMKRSASKGSSDYVSAIEETEEKSKSEVNHSLVEMGIQSLKKKTAPGQPPPQGHLTVAEVAALKAMGITPFKQKVDKPVRRISNKELARRRRRRKIATRTRRANRKK